VDCWRVDPILILFAQPRSKFAPLSGLD
jgi:hypothetical protein